MVFKGNIRENPFLYGNHVATDGRGKNCDRLVAGSMTGFEKIKLGFRMRGLDPSGLAEVVQVTLFGPDALNVVFRVDGRVDQRLVMLGDRFLPLRARS